MKLFGICIALVCFLSYGETRVLGSDSTSEEVPNVINVHEPPKTFRGQHEPTPLFDYSKKSGRIENRHCPHGEFLDLARKCVKRADFFEKNPPLPTLPPFYKKMGYIPAWAWDDFKEECLESGRVFMRKTRKCVDYDSLPLAIECNPGTAYNYAKKKCVKRTRT